MRGIPGKELVSLDARGKWFSRVAACPQLPLPAGPAGRPVQLEHQIQNACVQELASLGRFTAGPQHALYRALMHRYVAEDLKVLLRLFKQEGAQPEQVSLIHLPPAYALPVELLAESANVEQFLGRIPVGAIRRSALAALPIYRETGRKAFLEMAMDRGCWQEVGTALEELPDADREECEPPVKCEFDTIRLTAALRASRAYEVTWEQFSQLMPSGWGRLRTDMMRKVFEERRGEDVLSVLSLIGPRSLQHLPAGGEPDVTAIEDALRREAARQGHELFRSSDNGFTLLIGFFYIKQEETRQLLSLAQMIRRGTASQEIVAYLER